MKQLHNHKEFISYLRNNKQTLVYFFKDSCIKCKELKEDVNKIYEWSIMEKIEFCKVDINEDDILRTLFGEYGVPTFILFEGDRDGKEIPYPKNGYNKEYIINYLRGINEQL